MLLGDYDRKSAPVIDERLKFRNKICLFASSFCALKALVICLDFFSIELTRTYLTEVYLAEGKSQKIFDLGLSGLHAGMFSSLFYHSSNLFNYLRCGLSILLLFETFEYQLQANKAIRFFVH